MSGIGVGYLRGAAVRDEGAAKEALALALTDPDGGAAKLFGEAVADILTLPDAKARTERILGLLERLFECLLSRPKTGWAALRESLARFAPALSSDLRRLLPLDAKDWRDVRFTPLFLSFSLEFRARATAESLRARDVRPERLIAQLADIIHDREEKRALIELVQGELFRTGQLQAPEEALLRDFEAAPVVKRGRRFSSVYKPAETVVPAAAPVVLLVEPDAGVRNALKLGLRQNGYQVQEASNGFDAEALLFGTSPPSALVLEPRLAGVAGLTLLGRLRSRKPPLPVVLISAEESLGKEFEVRTHPRLLLLKKPVGLSPLLSALKTLEHAR